MLPQRPPRGLLAIPGLLVDVGRRESAPDERFQGSPEPSDPSPKSRAQPLICSPRLEVPVEVGVAADLLPDGRRRRRRGAELVRLLGMRPRVSIFAKDGSGSRIRWLMEFAVLDAAVVALTQASELAAPSGLRLKMAAPSWPQSGLVASGRLQRKMAAPAGGPRLPAVGDGLRDEDDLPQGFQLMFSRVMENAGMASVLMVASDLDVAPDVCYRTAVRCADSRREAPAPMSLLSGLLVFPHPLLLRGA